MTTKKNSFEKFLSDEEIGVFSDQIDINHKEVLKALSLMLKDFSTCHKIHLLLGVCYDKESFETGNFDKGFNYFSRSLELGCDKSTYIKVLKNHYRDIGLYHYINKNYEKSLEFYIQSLKGNDKDNSEFLCNVGHALTKLKRTPEARDYFNKAIKLKKNFGPAYYYLALSHYFSDDLQASIDCYEKALKIDPSNSRWLYDYGNCLWKNEEYEKAIKIYFKIRMLEPTNIDIYLILSESLFKMQRYEEVITLLSSNIELFNNDPDLLSFFDKSQNKLDKNNFKIVKESKDITRKDNTSGNNDD